jgi:hypothetical protein
MLRSFVSVAMRGCYRVPGRNESWKAQMRDRRAFEPMNHDVRAITPRGTNK